MMTDIKKYGRTKAACYLGFITQAILANFAPLLYLTFYHDYGLSLSRLSLISACFFFTQLVTDLVCVKAADRLGWRKSIIGAELLSAAGLIGLTFLPELLPSPFAGILLCTAVYAVGSGLIEVLCSPIIEACPFENKEGVMSLLHSFYCWGSVGVILGSTVFFALFGTGRWRVLALLLALVPLFNIRNFASCPMEPLVKEGEGMTVPALLKTGLFWLLAVLMVCAGASELSMAQWASAFVEAALHVSKTVGDLAGPCGFAVFMGLSRVFYAKFGERVDLTLFMIASGLLCLCCYLLAALASLPALGLAGCVLCGFSVGIMWPGSLSVSSAALPRGGTALFALLALAGDLGGALGPALVGAVSQRAGESLQAGVLAGIGFPLVLVLCAGLLRVRGRPTRPGTEGK